MRNILFALRNFIVAAWRLAVFRLTHPAHPGGKKHREREGSDKQHGGGARHNPPNNHAGP